jgi:hypothetical protein
VENIIITTLEAKAYFERQDPEFMCCLMKQQLVYEAIYWRLDKRFPIWYRLPSMQDLVTLIKFTVGTVFIVRVRRKKLYKRLVNLRKNSIYLIPCKMK